MLRGPMSKQAWRRAWFQVHKWIGLILAILIIPICLTGSALVWKGATDRIANPARYATSGATILPTERYTAAAQAVLAPRSEEHTSELQSLMRISYAVFCLKKNKEQKHRTDKRSQYHT